VLTPEQIKPFYPAHLWDDSNLRKFLYKEYLQRLILDYLTTTPFLQQIVFIGGTSLRLVKGLDRFSEDLDFDCKLLSPEAFKQMTDGVIAYLQHMGLKAEAREKPRDYNLAAFRRNIHFPELLFDLGLSGYRQERFLIKIESQDQEFEYKPQMGTIKGGGLFFKFPVPPDDVLCSMKISALLSRQKGRDFYDVMFLMSQSQTSPNYHFLSEKNGIHNLAELKDAFSAVLQTVDLSHKAKDFEHLAFNSMQTRRILQFGDFVEAL